MLEDETQDGSGDVGSGDPAPGPPATKKPPKRRGRPPKPKPAEQRRRFPGGVKVCSQHGLYCPGHKKEDK